jgi:hypothetical protein
MTLSLEEASLATIICFKIKTTWARCKTIHTLCSKKAHKTFKGRSHAPFANYTMLAHQWKNGPLAGVSNQKPLWQGEEMHSPSVNHGKSFFCLGHHHYGQHMRWSNMQNQICSSGICNDNINQGANVINQQQKNWKASSERTLVCSCETWNFTSLTL